MTNALTPITQAQRMLAEASSFADYKNLADYAEAARKWAKARGMGIEAENEAAAIILRCEREMGKALLALEEEGRIGQGKNKSQDVVVYEDLGISHSQYAHNYKMAARVDDTTFEDMLRQAIENAERLSKLNFYRAGKTAVGHVAKSRGTKDESGWNEFQRGAYTLLGWTVDEDGEGRFTKNGLTQLPNDQLHTLAVIVQELVRCYQEAKGQR